MPCVTRGCVFPHSALSVLDAEGYVLKPVLTEVRHVYVSLCPLINQGRIWMRTLIFLETPQYSAIWVDNLFSHIKAVIDLFLCKLPENTLNEKRSCSWFCFKVQLPCDLKQIIFSLIFYLDFICCGLDSLHQTKVLRFRVQSSNPLEMLCLWDAVDTPGEMNGSSVRRHIYFQE